MDISRVLSRTQKAVQFGLVLAIALTVTSCNIEGFFTKYGDDPAWVDPNASEKGSGAANVLPGQKTYGRICSACHAGSGKGAPGNNIPPLAGSEWAQGDAKRPISIVLHGFRGPIDRGGATINGQMAAWKDQLSDVEISEVLTFVRSQWGNKGSAVTVEEVKAIREATSARTTPFTEAELK